MNKFKSYVIYLIFTVLLSTGIGLPAIAHSENDGWGHNMAKGAWGWGPMIFFWTIGVLLVVLLTVTLVKTLRDW